MKRLLTLLLALICLTPTALAGGKKDASLPPQEGAYSPEYSVTPQFAVLPGEPFQVVMYRDGGTLPLSIRHNGGNVPSGVTFAETRTAEGLRQACIKGNVYAVGSYQFSVLVEEQEGDTLRTLAILHVKLDVTTEVETVEPYLGDGKGMLRLTIDGVNLRRTPGGSRLAQFDEGERFVWCATQEKGGYTWYRVWHADHGYAWLRGDMVQEEPPLRLVYTPGKTTAFPLFITANCLEPLTPSLIMTQAPDVVGFDAQPLVTVARGADTWTLLLFTIPDERNFWIQADLRDASGAPLECQLVYFTTLWEEAPDYLWE